MKKLFKGACIALAAATALTAAQSVVMADGVPSLPSAAVSELTGDALTVTMNPDYTSFSGLGGTYTMNKAVQFDSKLITPEQKAYYGNWFCDFEIKFDMPDGYKFTGDEVILIGDYAPYNNIGFKVSRLAEMAIDNGLIDRQTYEQNGLPIDEPYNLMSTIAYAATRVSVNLTLNEVDDVVDVFRCGLVDNDLPLNSKVTVQLTMYEPKVENGSTVRDLANPHPIGAPIIYTKTANVAITDKDAYVDNEGTGNLRFISTYNGTAKADEFGTWIVSENILDSKGAFEEGTMAIQYTNTADADELSDKTTFKADVMQIPADLLGTKFFAKSFVRVGAVTVWSDAVNTTVNESKNYTSK